MRTLLFLSSLLIVLGLALAPLPAVGATDPIAYALSDLRVMYLFDDPGEIDWPTIYYLNDRYGARVDLVSVETGVSFRAELHALPERQLFWHRFIAPEGQERYVDSILAAVWSDRRPDIILIGDSGNG
ncbi:MAG: hypothetical protein D6800_00530, partial [Candidatus Zixiibacteriota bacterium]